MSSTWRRPSILRTASDGAARRDTVEIASPPVVGASGGVDDGELVGVSVGGIDCERDWHRRRVNQLLRHGGSAALGPGLGHSHSHGHGHAHGHGIGSGRAKRKRKRRRGVRAVMSTFANHLTPPPHADPRALGQLRDACPTCAAGGAGRTTSVGGSSGRSSAGSGASLPGGPAGVAAAASSAAAGVCMGSIGLRARRTNGSSLSGGGAPRRAANTNHAPGGWMLADDEQYRAFPRRGASWSTDDESDGGGVGGGGGPAAPAVPVHAVVVDSDFAPARSPSPSESDDSESTRSKTSLGDRKKHDAPTPSSRILYYIREGIIIPLWHFADSRFSDPNMERHFQRERWVAEKAGAMMGSLYLLLQWILLVALQFQYSTYYYYAYLGIVGFFTVPLPFMVGFNGPRRFQWLYQPFVFGATWSMGYLQTIEMKECGYQYGDDPRNHCGERTFLHMLGLVYGLPTVASLGLWGHRVLTITGACVYAALSVALFVPGWSRDRPWVSQPICLVVFHIYISLWCYWRERADRQIFLLRQQLNLQYTQLETAQIMEHRAQHSKKQFVSYIFHEVRVPLNTALLAMQNLDAEGVFGDLDEDRGMMVHGLSSSLSMMEKVLNDVLSFNRMESGQLVQARKPFDFNKSIRVVALAHRAQADHAGVDFHVQLDPRVDDVGLLVGDEMRLRQVTSNLASNALKFTHHGSVSIVTKLLSPEDAGVSRRTSVGTGTMQTPPLSPEPLTTPSTKVMSTPTVVPSDGSATATEWDAAEHGLEPLDEKPRAEALDEKVHAEILDEKPHDGSNDKDVELGDVQMELERGRTGTTPTPRPSGARSRRRYAIVRVEVHDTGPGLRPADLAENRLFLPYVQTEIGRRQGGKGSGLGLALVMQLVKLSRGRLGVDSVLGQGSVFWFELQYPIYDPRPGSAAGTGIVSAGPGGAGGAPGSPASARFINLPALRNLSMPASKGRRQSAPSPTVPTLSHPSPRRGSDAPSRVHLRLGSVTEVSMSATPVESDAEASAAEALDSGAARRSSVTSQTDAPRDIDAPPSASAPAPPPFEFAGGWTLDATSKRASTGASPVPPTAPSTAPALPTATGQAQSPGSQNSPSPSSVPAPAPASEPATLQTQARPSPSPSPGTSTPAHTAAPAPAPTPPHQLSALVVDDDNLTRRLMSRMVTRLGARVTTAENGRAALETIAQNDFDVVFLDNQMPLMSGVEVARALRAQGSDLFVVGCTGNALEEDQNEYLSAGADSVLSKPIYQRDVERKLVEAQERRASRAGARGGAAAAHAAAIAQAEKEA